MYTNSFPNCVEPPQNSASWQSYYPRSIRRRANRLYSKYRGSSDQLIAQRSALVHNARTDGFWYRALNESLAYQFLHHSAFRRICLDKNVYPPLGTNDLNVELLPYWTDNDIKEAYSISDCSEIKLELRYKDNPPLPLDARSLRRLRRLSNNVGKSYGLVSREKVNKLYLGAKSTSSSLSTLSQWGRELLGSLSRTRSECYLDIDKEDSLNGVVNTLKDYLKEGSAIRLWLDYEQLDKLLEAYKRSSEAQYCLSPRSIVFIEDSDLTSLTEHVKAKQKYIAEMMGIPKANVHFYHMLPHHALPYISCPYGNIHLPAEVKVLIRDISSLNLCQKSTSGRLQFLFPLISSCSTLSWLSDLIGHLSLECPCECRAPALVVEEIINA